MRTSNEAVANPPVLASCCTFATLPLPNVASMLRTTSAWLWAANTTIEIAIDAIAKRKRAFWMRK